MTVLSIEMVTATRATSSDEVQESLRHDVPEPTDGEMRMVLTANGWQLFAFQNSAWERL